MRRSVMVGANRTPVKPLPGPSCRSPTIWPLDLITRSAGWRESPCSLWLTAISVPSSDMPATWTNSRDS